MSYQPLSKLISQVPTTKELHITTDNWPEERKKLAEIIRDPQNPDFNWWFWCGISNKQGLLDLVDDYKQISSSLLHLKGMKNAEIDEWFKDKIAEFGTPKAMNLIRDGKQASRPFFGNLNMLDNIDVYI